MAKLETKLVFALTLTVAGMFGAWTVVTVANSLTQSADRMFHAAQVEAR